MEEMKSGAMFYTCPIKQLGVTVNPNKLWKKFKKCLFDCRQCPYAKMIFLNTLRTHKWNSVYYFQIYEYMYEFYLLDIVIVISHQNNIFIFTLEHFRSNDILGILEQNKIPFIRVISYLVSLIQDVQVL